MVDTRIWVMVVMKIAHETSSSLISGIEEVRLEDGVT
jgi:hypothetical protein